MSIGLGIVLWLTVGSIASVAIAVGGATLFLGLGKFLEDKPGD